MFQPRHFSNSRVSLYSLLILTELAIQIKASGSDGYLWPLSYTMTSEAKHNLPSINPTDEDCFHRASGFRMSDSHGVDYSFDVLEYNGERRSYVETELSWETKKMAISIFVYAENDTATLLHFRSNYEDNSRINEIQVSMTQGIITTVFKTEHNTDFESIKHPEVMPLRQWIMINIVRREDGKMVILDASNNKIEFKEYNTAEHKDRKFYLNGRIRIGGSLDSPRGEFIGRLACLSMYPADHVSSFDEALKKCAEDESGSADRWCNAIMAKYVWPMNAQSYGYEATKHLAPLDSPPRSKWKFNNSMNGIEFDSSVVFGEPSSMFLTVVIPYDNQLNMQFSITMFVYPENNNEVAMMKVTSPGGYGTEMTVYISPVNLRVTLQNESDNLAEVALEAVNHNEWNFIAIQYSYMWEELSLIVNSEFTSSTISRQYGQIFAYPVTIELGSKTTGAYIGRMVCMTIFNTPLDELSALRRLREECNLYTSFSAPDENDPKPNYLWPLDDKSYGYEVLNNIAMVNPPDDLCWKFNERVSGLIDCGAVQFYGADRFHLEFQIQNLDLEDFAIGFFMKSEVNTTGTVMETCLRVDAVLTRIKVNLNVNALSVKIVDDTECNMGADFVPDDGWFFVLIQRKSGVYELVLNSVIQSTTCSSTTNTTNVELTIRLGREINSQITGDFRGGVRCLSIFNVSLEAERGSEIITTGCGSVDARSFVLPSGPGTLQTAVQLWKLDQNSNLSPKIFSDMEWLVSNSSVSFDGSSLLHVLIDMPINNIPDIAFGIFIRPTKYAAGTIFFAELQTGESLKISIEKNTIYVSFDIKASGCEALGFGGIEPVDWHLLFIQRVASCKKLIVYLDDKKQYSSSTCLPTENTGLLSIRLGGESRSQYNFRGHLSCLALFNETVPENLIKESIVESCNDQPSSTDAASLDNGYLTFSMTYTKHKLIQKDSAPYSDDPVEYITVGSTLHCARICTTSNYCRSFTIQKSETATSCGLFDFLTTSSGMKNQYGTNYYGLVYIESP